MRGPRLSPDPELLVELVKLIRWAGGARLLKELHTPDASSRCRVCGCVGPCTIFAAAVLAFETPAPLRVVADRPPRNTS